MLHCRHRISEINSPYLFIYLFKLFICNGKYIKEFERVDLWKFGKIAQNSISEGENYRVRRSRFKKIVIKIFLTTMSWQRLLQIKTGRTFQKVSLNCTYYSKRI